MHVLDAILYSTYCMVMMRQLMMMVMMMMVMMMVMVVEWMPRGTPCPAEQQNGVLLTEC